MLHSDVVSKITYTPVACWNKNLVSSGGGEYNEKNEFDCIYKEGLLVV